ncbi:MAG: ABC transporter ATP-binding protein [Clostridiales bacterium]|nr:ABC transporter ATP-binding protein [Clostridiales bacterium]
MALIKINGLSFAYNGRDVLFDVTLSMQKGTVTGIIGPNGSGKSTLLRLINALLAPKSGNVVINGKDVRSYSTRELARLVALVPQNSRLDFDFTVLDVVLMGRHPWLSRFQGESDKDLAIARASMAHSGITHLADRPVTRLSGGEWQRVVVARAFAQQTPVLLLDEPITGLDIRYQLEVMECMRASAVRTGMTIVCVLHDLNLALHYCDNIALLDGGRLRAFGFPSQLRGEVVDEVYGVRLIKVPHPQTGEPCLFPRYGAAADGAEIREAVPG